MADEKLTTRRGGASASAGCCCIRPARIWASLFLFLAAVVCAAKPTGAQLPFYTDNADVTQPFKFHFEFFNEYDGLQSAEYPNLRQNTANFRLNYGLPYGLELDIDAPYLSIYRAPEMQTSEGMGDTDMGVKWNFYNPAPRSHAPSFATSLYIEFPTGNVRQQLGSGLADYWLNFITQERLTERTRIDVNTGFLFAGNTSTGVEGIQTRRGHVYTGGISLQHDFTPRLTLGGELYGGIADNDGLAKSQLQGLAGGQYQVRNGLQFTFGLLGGRYIASPRIGGQIGFAVDFPDVWRRPGSSQGGDN
jgi:Putative MetA-pathway of phenol degradation